MAGRSMTGFRVPHIRYGYENQGGFKQGELLSVDEKVPADAMTVSPGIYFVRDEGDRRPKYVQENAEQAGAVAYSVIAESDAIEKGYSLGVVLGWLVRLAEQWFELDQHEYELYYSGNRSVHLHAQRVVIGEDGRKSLKQSVERFCETSGAKLDTGIYQRKGQFRLAGVEHSNGNGSCRKIRIGLDEPSKQIIQRSTSERGDRQVPDVVQQVAESCPRLHAGGQANLDEQLVEILTGLTLSLGGDDRSSPLPLGKEVFSPYVNATGGSRSVAVGTQKSEQILDEESCYIGADIDVAVGADGEFEWNDRSGFVDLSKPDRDKWECEPDDSFVIIGGASGSSIILDLTSDEETRQAVVDELRDHGRESALEILREAGYETGSAGPIAGAGAGGKSITGDKTGCTRAQRVKQNIDAGVLDPTYDRVFRVCCRLLKINGWNAAWEWLGDTLGPNFDAQQSYRRLRGIVTQYPDAYDVIIPDEPGHLNR